MCTELYGPRNAPAYCGNECEFRGCGPQAVQQQVHLEQLKKKVREDNQRRRDLSRCAFLILIFFRPSQRGGER